MTFKLFYLVSLIVHSLVPCICFKITKTQLFLNNASLVESVACANYVVSGNLFIAKQCLHIVCFSIVHKLTVSLYNLYHTHIQNYDVHL